MIIRVLLVDDQELMRMAFRMVLDSQPDIEVIGEAANGLKGVAEVARLGPDVVLMDVRMPELDGVEATRRILAADRGAKVIILTTFDLDEHVYDALRAGASGFLLKDAQPAELLAAIRAVAEGDAVVSPRVTRRLLDEYAGRLPEGGGTQAAPSVEHSPLTAREREVLELIAQGFTNPAIAELLVVSETTVKSHVGRILAKLQLRDRVHIVIYAYESGIVGRPAGRR